MKAVRFILLILLSATPTLAFADQDQNSFAMTRDEAAKLARWGAELFDRNKDGYVDWTEQLAYLEKAMASDPVENWPTSDELSADERPRFDAADTNHDGKLTKEEFNQEVRRAFDAADLDHDGKLSAGEIVQKELRAFDCMDTNRDQTVIDVEVQSNAERCQLLETPTSAAT